MRGLTELEVRILHRSISDVHDDVNLTDEEGACCDRLVNRGLIRKDNVSDDDGEWVVYTTTDLGKIALRVQDPSP